MARDVLSVMCARVRLICKHGRAPCLGLHNARPPVHGCFILMSLGLLALANRPIMAAKAVAGPTDFPDGQTFCRKEEKEIRREMPLSKGA